MKETKPRVFFCNFQSLYRCIARCSGFSICPKSIVALLFIPILWAISIILSHSSAFTLFGQITSRISLARISAPPPGIAHSPTSFNRESSSSILIPSTCERKCISVAVNALIITSGNLLFICPKSASKYSRFISGLSEPTI